MLQLAKELVGHEAGAGAARTVRDSMMTVDLHGLSKVGYCWGLESRHACSQG